MSVKTLVVFSGYQTLPVFYILDGDKRNWHGVVVNAGYDERTGHDGTAEDYEKASKEINDELYPAVLDYRQLPPNATELAKAIELASNGRNGLNFYTAVCGFAP